MHIAAAIKSIIDGNNLTEEQCYDAIYEVMSGEATDAQIAGLLIALRVKGETVEEITGGARALAERANRIAPNVPLCVDPVGTGGDGTNTFNISSTAAIVAAAGGAYVAKHGNRCISSRSGSADFYEAIGINIASAPIFLMKAESTATAIISRASCVRSELRFGKNFLMAISTMPERATAALTTRALPTMMTIWSEKPENISSIGMMPTATAAISAQQATMS